ncbi:GtrA family protein [Teredinibacter turnerae]|uniref:GtrA family protein n=1 Tax=Teredinibacter turnerae TaxID=2426 RepID=UPI00036BECDC|nr:GtrA family protein [Teredinibacter turnerae]
MINLLRRHLNRALIVQLAIFGVVGVSATLTHYFVALLSHERALVPLYFANILGYCAAVAISFFGHGKLTFRRELDLGVFLRFVVVSITTLGVSELLLFIMETWLVLSHRISLAVVVCTIPVITFLLSKLWVFRKPVVQP